MRKLSREYVSPTECAATVREAVKADAVLLAVLGAQTFRDTYALANKVEDINDYIHAAFAPAKIENELDDLSNRFFIAEIEGEPAGYIKMRSGIAPACVAGENPLELARLYVLKNWFGRGIGDMLMQIYLSAAQQNGHDALWLIVWKENHRALSFYRRWSFTEVGEHSFRIGANAQTDWVMRRGA